MFPLDFKLGNVLVVVISKKNVLDNKRKFDVQTLVLDPSTVEATVVLDVMLYKGSLWI
jgi:hypothetical protein